MGLLSLEDQFSFYGSYHTNKINILIHIIGVPTIFFTALILSHSWSHPTLYSIPLPATSPSLFATSFDLNWIVAVAISYASYFILLEPVAGLLYAPILLTFGHLSNTLYQADPQVAMKYATIGFVVSWIAQFVGHGAFEGRAPALFTSLLQSLVLAVFFVFLEVLFVFGYRPALHKKLQNRIGVKVAEYRKEKAAKARANNGKAN